MNNDTLNHPSIKLIKKAPGLQGTVAIINWMFGDGDGYEDTIYHLRNADEVLEFVKSYKVFLADIKDANKNWQTRIEDYRDHDKVVDQPGFKALFGEVDRDDVSDCIPSDRDGLGSPQMLEIKHYEGDEVFTVLVDGVSMW